MQAVINLGIILLILGFIGLVLNDLARSQKNSEPVKPEKPKEYTYEMAVRLNVPEGGHPRTEYFKGNSLHYLQSSLNNIPFLAIKDATVLKDGKLSHLMNRAGVLEAV